MTKYVEYDEDGIPVKVNDIGIPGLFPVTERDVLEEMANNEALREFEREQEKD
jgi:hypothetical protein